MSTKVRPTPGATLLLALVAVKLAVILLDPTIRVYLGDSMAYLAGALSSSFLPSDRSFVYSLLIRLLVRPFESLWALLAWQTLAGVFMALLLSVTLVRHLAISPAWAALAAVALAVEPAQLYYERMVMAETFGLLAFAAFLFAASAYLASGRLRLLPMVAVLGLAAASLRLNYLPVVLVMSVGLPLLWVVDGHRPPWRRVLAHAVVALCATGALHMAYRHTVAAIFRVPPSYVARAGFMQLGLVTPLIRPEHLTEAGLPPSVAGELQYPLSDRRARMAHMWATGGLASVLARHTTDVESVARTLSRAALAEDPLGLVRLGMATVGDYFRREGIEHALHNDLGRREIPPDALSSLREDWGYDAAGLPGRTTPMTRYFGAGTWGLVLSLLLLAPLAVANAIVHWPTPTRLQALLGALAGLGLVAAHVLFVNVAFYRYLHPLPYVVLLNGVPLAATLAGRLGARRRARRLTPMSQAPRGPAAAEQ